MQTKVINHLNGDKNLTEPQTKSKRTLYRGFSSNIQFQTGDHVALSQLDNISLQI